MFDMWCESTFRWRAELGLSSCVSLFRQRPCNWDTVAADEILSENPLGNCLLTWPVCNWVLSLTHKTFAELSGIWSSPLGWWPQNNPWTEAACQSQPDCSPLPSPLAVTVFGHAVDLRADGSHEFIWSVSWDRQHITATFKVLVYLKSFHSGGAAGQIMLAFSLPPAERFQVSYHPFSHHEVGERRVPLMFQRECQKAAWQFEQLSYSSAGSVWPSPKPVKPGSRSV